MPENDSFLSIYSVFDENNPLDNFIQGNDDVIDLLSTLVDVPLVSGVTYILVTTSYSAGETGEVSMNITGPSTLTFLTANWTGATDNDWHTTSNWNTGVVPSASTDVLIQSGLSRYPTATSAVSVNSITMESGTTFIPESPVTGTVTYTQNIANTDWHLIASPVSGETIQDYITATSLATGTGANIGLGEFNGSWNYFTSSSTGNFENGKGYATKLSTANDISFTGNLNTSAVDYTIFNGANSFNLVGNPYTAYINSNTFTTDNTALLFEETIWTWDGSQYNTHNNTNATEIAPAQAFFVEAKASNLSNFSLANRSHTVAFSPKEEPIANFELFIKNETNTKSTKVFYVDGKTTGFDNGYDSKMFGGITYDFAVFTELVSENEGNKLAIQTLPTDNSEAIPVGIIANAGEEIIFSVESLNLTDGTQVYLENKLTGDFINLSEQTYKTTLKDDANGVGQFYIHTSAKSLSTDDIIANNAKISIYKSNTNQITINGLNTKASVSVFSLLGTSVMNTTINGKGTNTINLPTLSAGVYMVKLNSEYGQVTKKVTLN